MKLLYAITLCFTLSGCATNGGPLDATFWANNYNSVRSYVIDKVVPDKVVEVVDTVIYQAFTPLDVKIAECKEKGGTLGSSEYCHLPDGKGYATKSL